MSARIWNGLIVTLVVALAGIVVAGGGIGLGAFAAMLGAGLIAAVLMDLVLSPPAPEPTRPSGGEGGEVARYARDLMRSLPQPLIVVGERGRIAFLNDEAQSLVPRLRTEAHISTLLRAPVLISALESCFDTGQPGHVAFVVQGTTEQNLVAHIGLLPGGREFGPGRYALIQIEDQTERRRADALRSDFIANASHELRTPLASIIGYIETLRGHAKDDPDARDHFLAIMDRQAGRMRRLVDDLMSLSRIEMFEHVRPSTRIDLIETVREAASALAPIARENGARIVIDLPDEPLVSIADRDQIQQVAVNLIDNAIRYGGEAVTITVSLAEDDPRFPGMAGISVSDTGPGIERNHIPRLTERFYRVSDKQSAARGGTGLGLAIVKHILLRHDGELDIASEPGRGSRFTIWLHRKETVSVE
ncbi:MAG: sensor histidine kinase [Rubricella sp.]